MKNATESHEHLKEYYGRVLKSRRDLKTSACCTAEAMPPALRNIIREIHPEIVDRFYGCGSPIPPLLAGCTVLDLGCGTGRDVYMVSRLVGEGGFVLGVDMTDEQLAVAKRHVDFQTARFGFSRPNMDFRKGYIEDLGEVGIEDDSVDLVISNCVLNLSPDKPAVFREIFRVLKPGGELFFSDIFAGRRVPDALKGDPVLQGECLAGAMYVEDFRRLLADLGCRDYRVVSSVPISMNNREMEAKVGMIDFHSITVRAFKLPNLEDICEDYGQVAVYLGTIVEHPHFFDLDDHHRFIAGKPMLVCGNTASMIENTRYSMHFQVTGDRAVHYGPFGCTAQSAKTETSPGGACC